ncbi:NAD(P)-dependent oxidoreductase [Labrys okinawensis]|uniref:NAD(P)-dependent oxidoreductase n=1 Tax=Labrys okinawensis TaxID=346911 RepID=UPI0039BC640B
MQIGFAGLGNMGFAMAANLVKAGHEVLAWNRSKVPVERLAALGAKEAATPAEAAQAGIFVTMLADDASTRSILEEGGALAALKSGAVHVCMATVSVAFAKEMAGRHADKGIGYIAAPVLGRVNVAEAGQLNILAAGEDALLDRVQPVFDVVGQKTWRFGAEPERANAVKLASNFMLVSAIESMAEASAMVAGHGVAVADFLAMATSTTFAAPVYKIYGEAIVQQRFEPAGFKLSLGLKDIRLALEAAELARAPMPFASALKDNLLDGVAHGEGHLDLAALSKVAARRAGKG